LANVARFRFDLERQLCRLQDELTTKTYEPGPYHTFEICEPKRRLISAAPFRDRVVHHALCNVLEPIFERCFVFDSYACRKGKGTHAAVARFQSFARRHGYVLKCDVRKFFPSIDHELLKSNLARKIKDIDVLWLIARIIDGSNPQEPVLRWYPEDDLLTPSERRRGLPIGNQTSQFFANVFLNPFDHFVTETIRVPGYVRYCDDFAIFGDDKPWLAHVRERCRQFLSTLRLTLHPDKSVISPVKHGCRFLGYRVFPHHRRLPRSNLVRFRRRLRAMQRAFAKGAIDTRSIHRRLVSWIGHALHANTERLRADILADTIFVRAATARAETVWGRVGIEFCVAAPGTIIPGTPARPTATGTHPTTGTTT
jgi:retron-type reverse transcriptase